MWKENDKDKRADLNELKKVKDIQRPTTKRERNYLREMTLTNARLWFRYRCKIIDHIKGNKSSMYKDNMACRLCTRGENETQEHFKKCEFTKDMRINLDLEIRDDKIALWRKITIALKDIYEPKKDVNKIVLPSLARKLVTGVVRVL